MKRLISVLLICLLTFSFAGCKNKDVQEGQKNFGENSSQVASQNSPEAADTAQGVCSEIVAGWNLGNTLEACHSWGSIPEHPTPEEQETGWNNPKTTKAMIDKVVETGFNAIRVPVTWGLQVEEKGGKYTIKQEWLDRVKEVVGYCLDNNVYVIVNMHHDDQTWLNISVSEKEWEQVKEKYRQLWEQIASEFKDHSKKLILEGANEITANTKFDGCGTDENADCWWGHEQICFDRLNELFKIFVDTVRATGGNNESRYLMFPTYGAQWYENQIYKVKIPNGDKNIILDVHWYQADFYAKENNEWVFKAMRDFADENGIGAVLGETGAMASYDDDKKINFAKNVVGCAKEFDIPVFLWDDGGDVKILERNELEWNSNAYVNEVIIVAKQSAIS